MLGAAAALVGSPAQLPAWLAESGNPARTMARFTPVVLKEAEAGDAVARGIVDEACRLLVNTVALAAGDTKQVALLGGVVKSEFFGGLLHNALASAGIEVVAALGDGLDGPPSQRTAAGSSRKGTFTVTEQPDASSPGTPDSPTATGSRNSVRSSRACKPKPRCPRSVSWTPWARPNSSRP
ncbi:hypothetical protein AHiyo8_19000 [Arthrobacter sp. Hiyo8]|nr:hypothetical protein AHiyo8_19000 [Arthrobacter sp. Hiyo8]